MSTKPAPADLHLLLRYDPEAGEIYWRERDPSWFAGDIHGTACAIWNRHHANTVAFSGVHPRGFRRGKIMGVPCKAHDLVWALIHGEWPTGRVIALDHDLTNLKPDNLKHVTPAEARAHRGANSNSTSGARGVYWNRYHSRYNVVVRVDGKPRSFGYFSSLEDACAKRDAVEAQHNNPSKDNA